MEAALETTIPYGRRCAPCPCRGGGHICAGTCGRYVQKYATAAGLVAFLRQCNSEFAEFLAVHEQTPALEGLNLMSFLVLPVQQLPRYG